MLDTLSLYNRNKKLLYGTPAFSDNLGQTVSMGQSMKTRRSTHYLKSLPAPLRGDPNIMTLMAELVHESNSKKRMSIVKTGMKIT